MPVMVIWAAGPDPGGMVDMGAEGSTLKYGGACFCMPEATLIA
jgi:hypothetical protein